MSYTLINFNIPIHLKRNFDHLARFKRVSRTSILNSMIEDFCRREFKMIKEDGHLNDLIHSIEKKNTLPEDRASWAKAYNEPLPIFISSDYGDPSEDGALL